MTKNTNPDFDKLYLAALVAGQAAGTANTPTPMVVGTPTTPFGNDIDYTKRTYFVADGVCGFAWVNVKPGTSAFAKWLVAKGYARKDSYYGGVTVWVSDYNQSYQRKVAHAQAFAKVLRDAGVKAYAGDRLD